MPIALVLLIIAICIGSVVHAQEKSDKPSQTNKKNACSAPKDEPYKSLQELQALAYERPENKFATDPLRLSQKDFLEFMVSITKLRTPSGQKPRLEKKNWLQWYEEMHRKAAAPTCYEYLSFFYALNTDYIPRIRAAGQKLKLPLPQTPPKFGTLPLGELNAYNYLAIPNKPDSRIIIFDPRIFRFLDAMTNALLSTGGFNEDGRFFVSPKYALNEVQSNPLVKQLFIETLKTFAFKEPERRQGHLDTRFDDYYNALIAGTELFVVAHEYAHYILNHEREGKKALLDFPSGICEESNFSIQLTTLQLNWQQELEADFLGFLMAKVAIEDSWPEQIRPIALSGAVLFFVYQDILTKSQSIFCTGKTIQPPSEEEKDRAFKIIESIADTLLEKGKVEDNALTESIKVNMGYPPNWLRLAFLELLYKEASSESSYVLLRLLKWNMDILFEESEGEILNIYTQRMKNSSTNINR